MDVGPGYKYIEKFRGGVQWYMIESKDNNSSICFKMKNENNLHVSFNGKVLLFDYQSKKFEFLHNKCLEQKVKITF